MSKNKERNLRIEDSKYLDGYNLNTKKTENKRQTRRFARALRIKNIDELIEDFDEEDEVFPEEY